MILCKEIHKYDVTRDKCVSYKTKRVHVIQTSNWQLCSTEDTVDDNTSYKTLFTSPKQNLPETQLHKKYLYEIHKILLIITLIITHWLHNTVTYIREEILHFNNMLPFKYSQSKALHQRFSYDLHTTWTSKVSFRCVWRFSTPLGGDMAPDHYHPFILSPLGQLYTRCQFNSTNKFIDEIKTLGTYRKVYTHQIGIL